MSDLQLGRVVVTERGVYQPSPLRIEVALLTLAMLVVLGSAAHGRTSVASVWLGLAVLAAVAVARFIVHLRYGPLGKPAVALAGGELMLALPQDSKGQAVVATAEFQQLVVYGRPGRRIFRFIRFDGTHIELTPAWGSKVECAAVEFLQRRLAPAVRVTVEEPQTLFASIRGDGP